MAKDKSKSKDETVQEEEDLRRSFEFIIEDVNTKFYLEMPTSEQIRNAEWHYSKVYNKALTEGVTTTAEMMDILTKRGLYGPDYEKKLQELQVATSDAIGAMHNADDVDKKQLALDVQALRDELYRWNQRLTGPLSNTCEQMADDAKTEYMTSVVVRDANGECLWNTYDEFISEENQSLALKARFEVLLWVQGLDSDFIDKTPENKVLKDIAEETAATLEADAAAAGLLLEANKPVSKPAKKTAKARTRKATK